MPPLRILIVRVGAMGDILHGMPAVAALRQEIPDCYIGWAVEPRWRALLEGHDEDGPYLPMIDRLHLVPTTEWKRHPFSFATLRSILRLRRELGLQHYHVCLDLQGSIRSAVIARFSGARRILGSNQPRERLARRFYTERIDTSQPHVIDRACGLVTAALHSLWRVQPAEVTLPIDAAAKAWCDERFGVAENLVLLVPTAGWGAKQWPSASYGALARQLATHGSRVLINASRAHEPLAAAIATESGAELVACTLPQLIALTRRVRLVVGGDTGPVHLAAALGLPVVALFGPTDPARNGPHFPGARVRVLRDAASVVDHRRHAQTEAGLSRISVDDVAACALEQLAQQAGSGQTIGGPHG